MHWDAVKNHFKEDYSIRLFWTFIDMFLYIRESNFLILFVKLIIWYPNNPLIDKIYNVIYSLHKVIYKLLKGGFYG